MYKKVFLISILLVLGAYVFIPSIRADIGEVLIIQLNDDTINPVTASYITDAIDHADKVGAECLVIELDTPGGLVSSTRRIVKKMMSSEVPVIVYVYPSGSRAGSAGVFITYASHVACMAPSTNIGAAHPISMGGGGRDRSIWDAVRDLIDHFVAKEKKDKDKKPEKKETNEITKKEGKDILSGKILHDTIAFIRAVAKERNRNIEWAEMSVKESASITAEEALEKRVIDIIAKDESDLLEKLDGYEVNMGEKKKALKTKNVTVRYITMDFRQRFLNVLANPNIAYILLLLGFYGLLFEVTHPGVGFPGIAGAICIILAFFSMQTLPTNYAGLALIILGIILFIAEVKVPGFGLLTLGGLVCMVLGSLLLFESPDQVMRVSISLIVSFTVATAVITIGLIRAVIMAHQSRIVSGKEGLIGEVGEAKTDIVPDKEGKVFVHGELWNAVSKTKIKKGSKVTVNKVEGMLLEVKEKSKKGG